MRATMLLCTLVATLLAAGVAGHREQIQAKAAFDGKHVLLFVTDQERETQHFPDGWEEANLPGLTRLKRTGVTFKRAYTNACMCTAARSSLWSGFMPSQSTSQYTLETDMPSGSYPQNPLSKPYNVRGQPRNAIANLAQVAQAAGYQTVYKGKFHLTKPSNPNGNYTQADLAAYGYERWNPPDAGANQDLSEGGGNPLPVGSGDNDFRIMNSTGALGSADEGALQYIREVLPFAKKPVFLVVSIVNPHDVLFYPGQFTASGYAQSMLTGPVQPPPTCNETLDTKPFAQQFYKNTVVAGAGPPQTLQGQTEYVNFYANLIKLADQYLVYTLNTLNAVGLTDKTVVIRVADHGEMASAHGNLIQKNFNMYEEATRIPLVFSNPKLWPTPKETQALVSHIDFLPTLQSLIGVPKRSRFPATGVDYSSVVMTPDTAKPPQDYVMFTYSDYQSGQDAPPYPPGPNFLRGLREKDWKIVQYYTPSGAADASNNFEYECYNLATDPLEVRNIGHPNISPPITPAEQVQLNRLKLKLQLTTAARLGPIPGFEWDVDLTANVTALPSLGLPVISSGGATGLPIGRGTLLTQHKMAVFWNGQPRNGRTTGTFAVTSTTGQIVGTLRAKVSIAGGVLTYTGTGQATGGSGSYRGFTSSGMPPLRFSMTSTLLGTDGKVSLAGRVTSAAVNGALILTPLDPTTGV